MKGTRLMLTLAWVNFGLLALSALLNALGPWLHL